MRPDLFNEETHIAKVYFNRAKKHFVIKNKYCLKCTKTSSYCCEPSKSWHFQQELGYFYIREENIEPKIHIKYTFAYLCLPRVRKDYSITSWCPKAIQETERRSYGMYDGKPELLHDVLNSENFRGSLRDSFYNGK